MKFILKDKAILEQNSGCPPLIRDQQASHEVLQYIVDALNEKWERDPHRRGQLPTHPEPTGHCEPLGRGLPPLTSWRANAEARSGRNVDHPKLLDTDEK
jgi:hypothetical protein